MVGHLAIITTRWLCPTTGPTIRPSGGRIVGHLAIITSRWLCPTTVPTIRPSGGRIVGHLAIVTTIWLCPTTGPTIRPSGGRMVGHLAILTTRWLSNFFASFDMLAVLLDFLRSTKTTTRFCFYFGLKRNPNLKKSQRSKK